MPQPLVGMELKEILELLGEAQPSFRSRQLYQALYHRRIRDLSRISNIPKELRERLAATSRLGLPSAAGRFESRDGTRRYLLSLEDQRTVEAVFMPEASRDTLCISSQVGCAVGCRFCLTARMGLERNLTAGEIVGQVLHLINDNGLSPGNRRLSIVLMGMGEPLLNLPNVIKATRILVDPEGVGLSERRITLSTAGLIPQIEELGREPVRPKLAISLNASTEEQRRELMPITRKYHLKNLIEACRSYPLRSWERLTFEYVLLGGVNDTDADARRVAGLVAQLRCKVNLIALNPGPGIPFRTPEPGRVAAFQAILRRSVPCFVRQPRGRDIFAACGQLRRMEADLLPPDIPGGQDLTP